jgi:hypothetical protein
VVELLGVRVVSIFDAARFRGEKYANARSGIQGTLGGGFRRTVKHNVSIGLFFWRDILLLFFLEDVGSYSVNSFTSNLFLISHEEKNYCRGQT